jgi:hypothetical protein
MLSQKTKKETEQNNSKQSLKKRFEELKSKEIKKSSKTVNFKKILSCGCGGSYEKFHAEFPIDSNVKDGQKLDDWDLDHLNAYDIKEGWV